MTVHASGWSGTTEAELEVTIQYPRMRGIITLTAEISIFVVLFLSAAFPMLYLPRTWSAIGAYLFCGVLAVGISVGRI